MSDHRFNGARNIKFDGLVCSTTTTTTTTIATTIITTTIASTKVVGGGERGSRKEDRLECTK